MAPMTTPIQILSVSLSLVSAGGIAALSLFDVPLLQSQPASRSLPSIRWLFSRGSHIFPSSAALASSGFVYLAYTALPLRQRSIIQLFRLLSNGQRVNAYLVAAALSMSIAPVTNVMIPTNFELIALNEKKGGARSQASADAGVSKGMSAEESVAGKGQAGQFTDLSGPLTKTGEETSKEEDERVRELLGRFAWLNGIRAVVMAAGGMVGLWAALL